MKPKRGSEERPRYKPPGKVRCAACQKLFEDTDLGMLSRAISQHKPACSYKCNRKLGQVK